MLEFQESFFEQEVRDGFYLDVTIKTLWASEMELLNKIAEVCNKYDLKWYAAYGTLLGAIRHEGFVPWDDDMDIWMMRRDYNKLMAVLPKELPEGYRVRGPQTDEGYDQFHTCVNNGSGISIAKDWLAANHNCPFTVGIDIFPLDYLPRNKDEQELQKSLFTLIGRVAQVAKNIGRGDYDGDNSPMTKKEAVAQVKEGLRYLKKNYKFSLDKQWLVDEEWEKITSEVWKWGNYVASMYHEEEADYVVEYLDWVRWEWKIYPKRWFQDGYSATFEDFMLPIPAGYDEILHTIYGDYMHFTPKTGCHEYPFYARQLRQLREYVKNTEEKAGELGIISLDEVEISDNHEVPTEWLQYTLKTDGTRKKIILMANDPNEYISYGNRALDKLEKNLEIFRTNSEKILLWWRPHPMMEKLLDQQDVAIRNRYHQILFQYKEAKWGICDESDDVECAVETCDAYYGGMNAIVQKIQNYPKPVMITHINGEEAAKNNNMQRAREYRCFLAYSDYVVIGDDIYFSNNNFNALVVVDKNTKIVKEMISFEGDRLTAINLHLNCVSKGNKIFFLPVGKGNAHIYDTIGKRQKKLEFANVSDSIPEGRWDSFEFGDDIYILPGSGIQGLWKWNVDGDCVTAENWWKIEEGSLSVMIHGKISDSAFFSLVYGTNVLYITDVEKKECSCYRIPDSNVLNMVYDGKYFWYTVATNNEISCWNYMTNKLKKYPMHTDDYYVSKGKEHFMAMYCFDGKLILLPQNCHEIFLLAADEESARLIYKFDTVESNFTIWEEVLHFKLEGKWLLGLVRNVDRIFMMNLDTMDISVDDNHFEIGDCFTKYFQKVLLERGALLYEDDTYGVNLFI